LDGARRRRAFRIADGFAFEAWCAVRRLAGPEGALLAGEVRLRIGRAGAALLAASSARPGSTEERGGVLDARKDLLEARYLLYLARRVGALDLKVYRRLTSAHDGADQDLAALAREGAS
jgi:hypothetical protein